MHVSFQPHPFLGSKLRHGPNYHEQICAGVVHPGRRERGAMSLPRVSTVDFGLTGKRARIVPDRQPTAAHAEEREAVAIDVKARRALRWATSGAARPAINTSFLSVNAADSGVANAPGTQPRVEVAFPFRNSRHKACFFLRTM